GTSTLRSSDDQYESKIIQSLDDAAKQSGETLALYIDMKKAEIAASILQTRNTINVNEYVIYFLGVAFLTFGIMLVIVILRFVYTQVGGEPVEIRTITTRITEGDFSFKFPLITKGIFTSIKILNQTMSEVALNAQSIANGDFTVKIIPQSESDQLGNSLAKMTRTLMDLQKVTEEISQGNFARRLEVKGENDLVSQSINLMSENLEKSEIHNKEQNWLKDGLNNLSKELSGDQSLEKITAHAISCLGRYSDAGRGVIYLLNDQTGKLHLVSSFAFTERDALSNIYELGRGVVGQVALEKKAILLRSVSRDEAPVTSGTTNTLPVNTYTYPILYEDNLMGVIELSSLQPFSRIREAYFEQSNQIIASSIFSAIQRSKIEILLHNSQVAQREAEEKTIEVQEANALLEEQSQQIRMQSEQLQQSNSQLEEQQQQLQQQSEELQQTNAQLEEQQQQLMQQTEELRQGNDHLQQAKTELDAKANDLEMSNKYKSDFLANMSHELRTPLNSIILLSKMMQKNERGNFNADDIKRARVVHSAGEELLRLINDILDISKIEAGKTSLLISDFPVEDLLTDLKHFFSGTAKNKGLELIIEDKLNTSITSDRDKVSQILRNFISNALKFTKNGSITVSVQDSGKAEKPVKITVRDTGIGIASEKHKMIFEAFQQVDSSISREFGGTGLGLTISQKLASLLRGEIILKSEEGKGSEFSLLLPVKLEPLNIEHVEYTKTRVREKQANTSPEPTPIKVIEPFVDDRKTIKPGDKIILVVEDDYTFADIVAMVIHNMNMKVLHAATAEQGLGLVQQFKVHGIVLDLVLPDMNGVDFMRRLKSYKDLRHIPVQIISGHEKNPELMRMGALDFLQKPVDQEQIQTAIQGILNFSEKNPKDLLIVEDDEGHRNALIELIQSQDIRVNGVETEEEATKELQRGIYDAVIIDLGLKSGSGINICKYARENQIKAPIIVYTGKQLSAEEEKNLKRYADRIIIKTVHSENRLLDELMLFLHQTQRDFSDKTESAPDINLRMKRLSGKTIMVVDDDIKNVFVLSTALEEHGARVIDAQNGKEALRLLEEKGADLVLMDIMMPVMDGYTAIAKIRENYHLKKLPVIALTAKALKEDREKCIAAGADDYLSKPVDYEMLIGLVEAWCQKKG
ncbi:MAG: response regulator, partial [Bacteroidetes bacterium]|nr:response regulator [Bacteroidota bacterium]